MIAVDTNVWVRYLTDDEAQATSQQCMKGKDVPLYVQPRDMVSRSLGRGRPLPLWAPSPCLSVGRHVLL